MRKNPKKETIRNGRLLKYQCRLRDFEVNDGEGKARPANLSSWPPAAIGETAPSGKNRSLWNTLGTAFLDHD